MSREQTRELLNFALEVQRQAPSGKRVFSADLAELVKIAKVVSRLDTADCNGYRTDAEQERADKRTERLLKRASEIAREYDMKTFHQGDPRGWPLYLIAISTLIDKCQYQLTVDGELSPETSAFIHSNYPQAGIAVPPF